MFQLQRYKHKMGAKKGWKIATGKEARQDNAHSTMRANWHCTVRLISGLSLDIPLM
jgi:hypothetical protein